VGRDGSWYRFDAERRDTATQSFLSVREEPEDDRPA
jgi:hypothetical protein